MIHKAQRCMNSLDHSFYNHGARSVCGRFLARNRVALELKVSLDDKSVTCKKCLAMIKKHTDDDVLLPCLHSMVEGRVSRLIDDHVAIEFATPDGGVVEHVYHRDQFVEGKLPQEGDVCNGRVFVLFASPEPTGASKYLTAEELENGFPGFQRVIDARKGDAE